MKVPLSVRSGSSGACLNHFVGFGIEIRRVSRTVFRLGLLGGSDRSTEDSLFKNPLVDSRSNSTDFQLDFLFQDRNLVLGETPGQMFGGTP